MFDNVELPIEIAKYIVSITPVLAIFKEDKKLKYKLIEHIFWVEEGHFLVKWPGTLSPKSVIFNILKKGEDKILINAILNQEINKELLADSTYIAAPRYRNCVLNFECNKASDLEICENYSITKYKVLSAYGVMGLEPNFNDSITISKTIEVMSLTPVDAQIIKKKINLTKK